jgi:AcrR family transcriptional regulator
MATTRPYRSQRRQQSTARTRARIVDAVRELLVEGSFPEATVEDVARRAGVSRATVYQHFGSRLDLINALCDSLAANPELLELRKAIELDDPAAALEEFVSRTARFWASEERLHRNLYGFAAIDPAAADYVERQRADRRGESERLARRLRRDGALRAGLGERGAILRLLVLTSFTTYDELRREGRSQAEVGRTLRELAAETLLASVAS